MPDIRLITLDLDGTLLNSKKELSPENAAALQWAADQGIEIVPNTGRFFDGMPEVIRNLPYLHYAITINGAQVYMNIDPQQNADTAITPMSTNGLSMGGLEIVLMHNMIKSTIDNIEIKSYENRNQVEIKFLNEDMSLYKFINSK